MLVFDAAVVLESQSDEIWEEYMSMHPATARIRYLLSQTPHVCDEPRCELHSNRGRFQTLMKTAFRDDVALFMKFLEKVNSNTSPGRVAELLKSMKKSEDLLNYVQLEKRLADYYGLDF